MGKKPKASHQIATAYSSGVYFIGIQPPLTPEQKEGLSDQMAGWAEEVNPHCSLYRSSQGQEFAERTVKALSIGLGELTHLPNHTSLAFVGLQGYQSSPFRPNTDR